METLSMTAPRFHLSGFPRAIGFAVLLNFLAVLWLAASPALHGAAHADASDPEHTCCVTMFEAGTFHAPTLAADFATGVTLPLIARVEPVLERIPADRFFLGVLEHAPPTAA